MVKVSIELKLSYRQAMRIVLLVVMLIA